MSDKVVFKSELIECPHCRKYRLKEEIMINIETKEIICVHCRLDQIGVMGLG